MRELTVAEYRAMLAILAHPGETEQHRIQLAGLPSSTYNVVRRRVYEEGWLSDVMVPSPGPCGFAGVEFRLTRPSLSARDSLVSEWTSDPGCVLLWSGVHAVFGVFFRSAPPAGADAPDAPQGLPGLFRVFVHRDGGTIPSYFDYSGLWARFGGEPEPPSYPAGLDVSSGPAERRALAEAFGLLNPDPADERAPPRWTNLVRLPRSPRRALEKGLVESRTILNVGRLPPFDGRRIGEVVLIRGRLKASATAEQLLGVLVGDCAVFPFLVAESGGNLIVGGVGQTSAAGPGRVPVAAARRPVMTALTDHLEPADVLIEPAEAIEERVGHRYPRTVPALRGAPSEAAWPHVNPS